MTAPTLRSVLLAGVMACVLAACGERPQTGQAPLKKLDIDASNGTGSAFVASGWKQGDETSWENHMRKRAQGQNEYARIAVP